MRLPAARNSLSVHIYTICMEREFLIMEITEYIKPELIVVALALYFLDMALRKSALIQERYIVFLTGSAGILICALYVFAVCGCSGP